ncbi:MAG: fused MFS/spermidine synthase [Acidobacteria bacterium]|nr:fused MFS/spermidine synthase [Acidobacteriota bacterium]
MGATFPLMMAYVKARETENTTSFSYLYLANVIGAMCGTLITSVFLIELLGFSRTLWVAGVSNFLIAGISFELGRRHREPQLELPDPVSSSLPTNTFWKDARFRVALVILFTTGLTSMAFEVVWTRAFNSVLGTQVYSFASVLFVYLLTTWIGALIYRHDFDRKKEHSLSSLIAWLVLAALLPILLNDPRLQTTLSNLFKMDLRWFWALASIGPFCGILGYLTPGLIDQVSLGNPKEAGIAYAFNILGCILGPLLTCYIFLPSFGAQTSIVIMTLPIAGLFVLKFREYRPFFGWGIGALTVAALIVSGAVARSYEGGNAQVQGKNFELRRDHVATVMAYRTGDSATGGTLLVNGVGITKKSTITKFMAHLPMVFCPHKPESSLVICFGMGTTYRSLLSWGGQATAVELSPSVTASFGFFFKDAEQILRNPKGKIVVDDGRRFLQRTNQTFDVITIDPPPPAESAGSSLLYSEEFYQLVKLRLHPDGVFQQWFGEGDDQCPKAIAQSLCKVFPYVRVFHSVEGWGYHFLASSRPIMNPDPAVFSAKFPESAHNDLVEWVPQWSEPKDFPTFLNFVLSKEIPVQQTLPTNPNQRITDDRPFNEYYLVRRYLLN